MKVVEVNKRTLLVAPVVASLAFCNLAVAQSTAQEATSPVVINEVESNGDAIGDFVELANTDTNNSVDISGWSLVDDKNENPVVLPAGTEIESGGYFLIYPDTAGISTNNTFGAGHFGLGKDDTVTLRDAEGNEVATYSWADLGEHAATTYGRVPDMTGEFTTTGASTPGLANIAGAGEEQPEEETVTPNAQLPFHNAEVLPVELGGAFVSGDMSGVDFDNNGVAWVVNNGSGAIYALEHDAAANTYTLLGQWQTTYPEGTGTLDAEGIAVADNGDIYLATERNNSDKNVSRPSIVRFANPLDKEGTQVALQEWNLAEFTGTLEANGGLEAIAQLDENIFAVGVEQTGDVLVVNTAAEAPELLQRYDSAFPGVMALDYNADSKKLTVACDEECAGASEILTWDGTQLTKTDDAIYERPANLGNWANEGFAAYTTELECTDGSTTTVASYLWADDAATNNFNALNAAQVVEGECEVSNGNDDDGDTPATETPAKDNGSSTFAAGSVAGSLATTVLAVLGISAAIGGFVQQILAAFPQLKAYIRF